MCSFHKSNKWEDFKRTVPNGRTSELFQQEDHSKKNMEKVIRFCNYLQKFRGTFPAQARQVFAYMKKYITSESIRGDKFYHAEKFVSSFEGGIKEWLQKQRESHLNKYLENYEKKKESFQGSSFSSY